MAIGRRISMIFRGFDVQCTDIVAAFDVQPERYGSKGDLVKPGVTGVLRNSFVTFSRDLNDDIGFDGAVMLIMDHLGGAENILRVSRKFEPKNILVDIYWPVRGNDVVSNGHFSVETMAHLVKINSTICLSIP